MWEGGGKRIINLFSAQLKILAAQAHWSRQYSEGFNRFLPGDKPSQRMFPWEYFCKNRAGGGSVKASWAWTHLLQIKGLDTGFCFAGLETEVSRDQWLGNIYLQAQRHLKEAWNLPFSSQKVNPKGWELTARVSSPGTPPHTIFAVPCLILIVTKLCRWKETLSLLLFTGMMVRLVFSSANLEGRRTQRE